MIRWRHRIVRWFRTERFAPILLALLMCGVVYSAWAGFMSLEPPKSAADSVFHDPGIAFWNQGEVSKVDANCFVDHIDNLFTIEAWSHLMQAVPSGAEWCYLSHGRDSGRFKLSLASGPRLLLTLRLHPARVVDVVCDERNCRDITVHCVLRRCRQCCSSRCNR